MASLGQFLFWYAAAASGSEGIDAASEKIADDEPFFFSQHCGRPVWCRHPSKTSPAAIEQETSPKPAAQGMRAIREPMAKSFLHCTASRRNGHCSCSSLACLSQAFVCQQLVFLFYFEVQPQNTKEGTFVELSFKHWRVNSKLSSAGSCARWLKLRMILKQMSSRKRVWFMSVIDSPRFMHVNQGYSRVIGRWMNFQHIQHQKPHLLLPIQPTSYETGTFPDMNMSGWAGRASRCMTAAMRMRTLWKMIH